MSHLVFNIKRVQGNQSSSPPLKPSENLLFFNNSRSYKTQMIHSNLPNIINKILRQSLPKKYKIRLFTYFTATGSRIPLFHLALEFLREFKFLYFFGIFFHRRPPLKNSACVPYRQILVSSSFIK